jgi:hypothetical protein
LPREIDGSEDWSHKLSEYDADWSPQRNNIMQVLSAEARQKVFFYPPMTQMFADKFANKLRNQKGSGRCFVLTVAFVFQYLRLSA